MAMALTLTLIPLAAAIGWLLLMRFKTTVEATTEVPTAQAIERLPNNVTDLRFRSVGIDTGVNCCKSAEKVAGRRFLIKQAPGIPLQDCDSEQCECKFIHFADRRDNDPERRGEGRFRAEVFAATQEEDRRLAKDRRTNNG